MKRTKAQEKVHEAIELAVENVLEELSEYLAKHGLNVSVDVQVVRMGEPFQELAPLPKKPKEKGAP